MITTCARNQVVPIAVVFLPIYWKASENLLESFCVPVSLTGILL